MFKSLAFCLVLFTITAVRSEVQWWSTGKSIMLDADNFNDYIGKNKHVIVNFFSKYSADSETMAPEWDILAEKYMGPNAARNDIIVAMIDGWTNEKISDLYGVSMLPQILLFTKGQHGAQRYFSDGKTAEKYADWLESLIETAPEPEGVLESVPEIKINEPAQVTETVEVVENSEVAENVVVESESVDEQVVEDIVVDVNDQATYDEINQSGDVAVETPEEVAEPVESQEVTTEEPKKEVKVVLNPNLLQSQFETIQTTADNIKSVLEHTINDSAIRIDELKEAIASQREEMMDLYNSVKESNEVLAEVAERLFLGARDSQPTMVNQNARNLEEAKVTMEEVYDENTAEIKQGTTYRGLLFLIGTLGGAVLTYLRAGVSGKKQKARALLD